MKRLLATLSVLALLTACVDTTGISPQSSKTSNPKSNPNAAVTVTEYGDLQCPACRAAYTIIDQPLLAQYGSQINFVWKQFPLTSLHQYAMAAAEASECAADQGKFWEFLDTDYTNQDQLNNQSLETWAKQLGLNMDLFDRCTKSHIKRKEILAEYDEGQKLGVQGTPTFFVNGQMIQDNTLDSIGKAITDAEGSIKQKL
ncbi:MAG TPA: thioredoxin domain-containing protein [Candidatus Peribacteraceae bacterium]|nr:thioredoxin domain-containing protein [Candidatus Peribacteraceae bacterium]